MIQIRKEDRLFKMNLPNLKQGKFPDKKDLI